MWLHVCVPYWRWPLENRRCADCVVYNWFRAMWFHKYQPHFIFVKYVTLVTTTGPHEWHCWNDVADPLKYRRCVYFPVCLAFNMLFLLDAVWGHWWYHPRSYADNWLLLHVRAHHWCWLWQNRRYANGLFACHARCMHFEAVFNTTLIPCCNSHNGDHWSMMIIMPFDHQFWWACQLDGTIFIMRLFWAFYLC